MEQPINPSVRPRRTAIQINHLLDEFEKSTMSVTEFCIANDVCTATYHKWCSRYRSEGSQKIGGAGFTSLEITPSSGSGYASLFAEVRGIKIYQPVTAGFLKELIL